MNNHSTYNADRLEGVRRATARAHHLAVILNTGILLGVALLATAAVDYCWSFSSLARWGCFGGLGLVLGAGVARLVQLLERATGIKQTALAMEAKSPELGCVVSTAAEYISGERQPSQEYEPELVDALQEQAAGRLRRIEMPCYRRLLLPGVLLGLLLGITLLTLFLVPGYLTALIRIAAPWSPLTYTTVTVKPGNGELPVGSDLNVGANFGGRPPKDPHLRWREQSGANWQALALTCITNVDYTGSVQKVLSPIRYQVIGNDGVSPEYTMLTYIPPAVKTLDIGVQLPAYTKAPPTVQHDPNLSVLRASQLSFNLTSTAPLATARLHFTNQPSINLVPGVSNLWTGSLTLTNELYYWVELADAAGHKGGNEKAYHLTPLPDEPPKVEIVDPGMDIRAEATNRVPLKISVTDDYGVGDLKLIYRKVGGPEHSIVYPLPAANQKSVTVSNLFDLTPLALKEYELVAYYAVSRDNNTLDGPGIGKSPVYFIEYTTNGAPLSQSSGNGSKINLLQIEKQIIAATFAVKPREAGEKLPDIATIQRQAKSYAEIYRDALLKSDSPAEAKTEFAAAIDSMRNAAMSLDGLQRQNALADEDSALEHLYQVTRLLPPLKECMCQGNGTKIVLEAIEKLKEAQKKKRDEEIPKILKQAKALAAEQAKLNDISRQSQKEDPKKGSESTNSAAKAPAPGASKPGDQPGVKPGEGKSQETAQEEKNNPDEGTNSTAKAQTGGSKTNQNSVAKAGSGPTPEEPKPDAQAGGNKPQKPTEAQAESPALSKEQQKLSETAAALAEKLRELSGKDPRVSGSLANKMTEVSKKMAESAHSRFSGPSNASDDRGGVSGLASVIKALEQLLNQDLKPSDVAAEEYPQEYESLISEYLRNLSFTE